MVDAGPFESEVAKYGVSKEQVLSLYISIVALAMVLNGCGNVAVVSDNGGSSGIGW